MKRTSLIFLICTLFAGTALAKDLSFRFLPTASIAPDAFAKVTTGPFNLPFVADPEKKFYPSPSIPSPLEKKGQDATVRAALRVGTDGRVKEVRILQSDPKGAADPEATEFFMKVVYRPYKPAKKAVEFETDVILAFKFSGGK